VAREVAANRIRLGILALPMAGMLELATTVLVWSEDTRADRDWAELVVSTRYEAAQFVDLLSTVLYLFGIFALYACVAMTRGERWSLAGLIVLVGYMVSWAVITGTDASVDPFVGRQYLEGHEDAFAIYESGGYTGLLNDAALFAYGWGQYAGFMLFGIGVWRSGLLPQGAVVLGIAFAVLTPIAWAVSAGLGFLGPLLLVIAEAWVAWAVWRQLSPMKLRSRVR
jgi:hypothetical protein